MLSSILSFPCLKARKVGIRITEIRKVQVDEHQLNRPKCQVRGREQRYRRKWWWTRQLQQVRDQTVHIQNFIWFRIVRCQEMQRSKTSSRRRKRKVTKTSRKQTANPSYNNLLWTSQLAVVVQFQRSPKTNKWALDMVVWRRQQSNWRSSMKWSRRRNMWGRIRA